MSGRAPLPEGAESDNFITSANMADQGGVEGAQELKAGEGNWNWMVMAELRHRPGSQRGLSPWTTRELSVKSE